MKQPNTSTLLLSCWAFICLVDKTSSQQVTNQQVFINEFHYRNWITDIGQFVEVAIVDPSITNNTFLGGLVLYDGSTGGSYKSLTVPEATIFGRNASSSVLYLVWDVTDILDEAPNGIALHDGAGTIIEFISYGGGSFKAVDGVANGMISIDIGYSQDETNDSNNSLQRIGIGAEDIVTGGQWVLAPRTRGAVNVLQNFGKCSPISNKDAVQLNEIHYDNIYSDSGEFVEFVFQANAGISSTSIGGLVLYDRASGRSTVASGVSNAIFYYDSNDNNIGYIVWDIGLADGPNGVALVDSCNSILQFVSYEGSFLGSEGVAEGQLSTDIGYSQSGSGEKGYSLQRIGIGFDQSRDDNIWVHAIQTKGKENALQTFGTCNPIQTPASIQLNELHYSNLYSDTDEFIEFVFLQNAGVVPTAIGGLVLYDGASGKSTSALTFESALLTFDKDDPNVGYVVWSTALPDSGPTGFALVDHCNTVVHLISYGGSFQAKEGVAKNMVSTDIRYSQSGNTDAGYSLQRIGIGYNETQTDNNWVLGPQTKSAVNEFQTFGSCSKVIFLSSAHNRPLNELRLQITNKNAIQINEIHYNNIYSDSDEFIEFAFLADNVSADNIGGILLYGSDGKLAFTSGFEQMILFFDDIDPGVGFAVWGYSYSLGVSALSDDSLAMALLDGCNNLIQFVSYGGQVTATEGPAKGVMSLDIGYTQTGTGAAGESLQRQSCLNNNVQSEWLLATNTRGGRNNNDQDVRSCLEIPGVPTAPIVAPTLSPVMAPLPTDSTLTPTVILPTVLPTAISVKPTRIETVKKSNEPSPSPATNMPGSTVAPSLAPVTVVVTAKETSVVLVPPFENVTKAIVLVFPENANVTVNKDGSISFVPDDDFEGKNTVVAEFCNAENTCTTQSYTLNVTNESNPDQMSNKTWLAALAVIPIIFALITGLYVWNKHRTRKEKGDDQRGAPEEPVVNTNTHGGQGVPQHPVVNTIITPDEQITLKEPSSNAVEQFVVDEPGGDNEYSVVRDEQGMPEEPIVSAVAQEVVNDMENMNVPFANIELAKPEYKDQFRPDPAMDVPEAVASPVDV